MKQVAQLALRHSSRYVLLFEHELEVLRTLPLWMTPLFVALVRASVYQTGIGKTTYAELVDALTPLQPRTGKRNYVPSEWAIWRALLAFNRAHIVWRNTGWSERQRVIIFELAPRKAPTRPKAESAPVVRTGTTSLKNEQRRGL